ncbi:Na/Pi cotransporter family protein [Ruegeria sp. PrR005]|uniref:Na/Pi cotransporter family protein n=2 Tax=Ruegeria sp. PrR005 TaxID=2706882 RepID=A0A6B2NRE7_9RHOB|nr:Na/Pi cotransporter family protein [Ruegeria sp. PrR005]
MDGNFFLLVGGIGMFLLGMEIMTAALRDAAGSNLRTILTRFTTTPMRGVLTGAATTAVVQSSSATTVMTVGFVGAGLLSMPQALGVLFGANIGTTATGWLVSILGFKLKLGNIAMALLLPAALADLLGRGTIARAGRVLAGLCLLLIGLDLMQSGAGDLTAYVTPDILPSAGPLGLLAIVGLGAGITIVMQSSSAAMALSLVMLSAGAISLVQAAAIVIGMNIGTTFTAVLASTGGSVPMRQTALANLLFNIVTSVIAFPTLLLIRPFLEHMADNRDAMTALLVFHTGFNLVGTALFLPWTARFADWVARIMPDKKPDRLFILDRGILGDANTALLTAQSATALVAGRLFSALASAMAERPDYRPLSALGVCEYALEDLRGFLSEISLSKERRTEMLVYSDLLHQIDHLSRLLERATQTENIDKLLNDRLLRRPTLATGAALGQASGALAASGTVKRLERLGGIVHARRNRHRRAMLLGEHAGLFKLTEVFSHTDAMRWLDRVLHHAERVAHYHRSAAGGLPAADGSTAG